MSFQLSCPLRHAWSRVTARVAFAIALATTVSTALAQSGSMRVTVPSPNAASLGKFGDVPVSLYTGVPDISIPLFTAKGRTLEVPIALRYHGGGIKVEEIGSWVGIGWALEAGGSITRTVRGLVDESASGYYNTGHTFYNSANWPAPPESVVRDIQNGVLDGDPDQFFFSFGGRSGQFVMGPTSTSPTVKEFRTIPYQKWKIEPTLAGAEILAWIITTEDGTQYTFAAVEGSTDRSSVSPFPSEAEGFSRYGESYTSAWHLTQIRHPGGDVVTLYYNGSFTTEHRQGGYQEVFGQVTNQCVPSSVQVIGQTQINPLFLDSIKTAAHTVHFVRGSSLRSDALSPLGTPQEPRLDVIKVTTATGSVLRKWRFEHDYSTGRLTLKNLYEEDRNGVSLPPYSFTYAGPGAGSLYAQDHWGFYNGASNSSLIPTVTVGGTVYPGADREPNATAMVAGSLTKITYPTGGYNEFIYEPNDRPGWGLASTQFAGVSSSSEQGPIEDSFTIGGTQPVTVTANLYVEPSVCQESEHPCPYVDIVGHGPWTQSGVVYLSLSPGTYTLRASDEWYPGNSASITVEWQEAAFLKKKIAGGLRVAEMRTADAMGNVTIRKYRYTLESDTTMSSGVINREPQYHYSFNTPTCSYFSRSSVSKIPMGDGPILGYSEVTVWRGANGEFGRTRHEFRSGADGGSSGWPFFVTTSFAWERGQELEAKEYDSAGRPQRKVASSYRNRVQDQGGPEPISSRLFRGISVYTWPGIADNDLQFFSGEYQVISGWLYQDGVTTTVYDTLGTSSFSTSESFTYANPNHAQLTEATETNSDGTQRITKMKYPADFAAGSGNAEATALTAMQGSAHIHSPAIERWVTKRNGGVDSTVQAEMTTFKTYAAGQYLPYQRFLFSNPTPVANFLVSTVSGGTFTKDSRYVLQETANTYDGHGRITQLADARGSLTDFLYGGNPNNAFLTKVTRVKDGTGLVDLVTDLAYDSLGFLSSMKDEAGTYRFFTYDLFGRLRQIKNHGGSVVKAFGYAYSRTSPSWTFNPSSPNAVVDTTFIQHAPTTKSLITTAFLDGLGRPIQTVVQDGSSFIVTASQYDLAGRPWRSWKPYTRTTAGFDASFSTNATNYYNTYHATSNAKPFVETQYRPDALDRVSKVVPEYIGTSPSVFSVVGYGIDATPKHQFTERVDASGKKTRHFDDVFGHEVKTVLGHGAAEATTTLAGFNILGQRLTTTDPRGLVTSYALDTRGLLASKNSPDAGTVLYKHDKNGNLRYTQDANDVAFGHVNFTNYDFANRPLVSGEGPWSFGSLDPDATTLPLLETSTNAWQVVRAYDAKPSTAALPWSLFSAEIAPLTLANVSGRLAAVASKSNGAWQATLFSYDADGRLLTRHTFTQANGGASVLAAVNTQVEYVRDLRDAVTERRLTVGSSGFNHWNEYDNRGLLWKVFASTGAVKPATPDVTFTYRPSGQLQDRQFQGGPLVPLRYTIREEIEKIGDPTLTSYPFSARYAYHANGTVSEAEFYSAGSPATQKRYKYAFPGSAYDALNRLKSADFSGWNGSSWTSTLAHDLANIAYDASGNLTALQRYRETGTLVDNLTYAYPGTSNRLSSVTDGAGSTPELWDAETGVFTYDANGNILTAPAPYGIGAVSYDHRNLPVSLTSNGVTSSYRYDGPGQRITKQVAGGNTEVYVLEGPSTLGVMTANTSGTPVSWHFNILAGDRVVGRQPSSGNRRYYHTDLLGSTRAVVDGTTIVESYDPEPWGLLMPARTLGGGSKEGFSGKERDTESGLDYFGARMYMPALGRWTGADPLAEKHPQWSPYAYVLNNPLVLLDPDGRQVSAQQAIQIATGVATSTRALKRLVEGGAELAGMKDFVRASEKVEAGIRNRDLTSIVYGIGLAALSAPTPAGRSGGTVVKLADKGVDVAAKAARGGSRIARAEPNRIYSAKELIRRAEEPGPFHNFPESFNERIFRGQRTVISDDYVVYSERGTITLPGKEVTLPSGEVMHEAPRVIEGTYEIGVRPSTSGRTEVITHRFFRPDEKLQ